MIIQSKPDARFIEMVADRLAQKFIKRLFLLQKERNYYVYIGGLAEMLDWSIEFSDQYYDKIISSKSYAAGSDTADKTAALDALIVAFGNEKIKHFYAQRNKYPSYYIKKYSAAEL